MLRAMSPMNFLNFSICFAAILMFLNNIPLAYEIFVKFSALLLVIRLSEWMMTRTRKYVLNRKVSSENKAVLITGCDSGIGHQIARRLDKSGFHVFAACLSPEGVGAKSLQSSCSSRLCVVPLDVTSDKSVQEALNYVENNLKGNDLWAVVNNAGIAQAGEIDWTPLEEFQQVYDVNTVGTVRVTKAFLPLLRKARGRVINNTSLCGHLACPGYVAYCMSKSAAVAFTTGLRIEMMKWGVKSISVEPFFYKTPLTTKKTYLNLVESTWNKATEESKQTYGIEYMEAFKDTCIKVLDLNSPNLYEVIDCFEDAVSSTEPLSCYFPCYFPHKIGLKLLRSLPAIIAETYQGNKMPRHVIPSALANSKSTKHKVNGNSNHSNGCNKHD